MYSSKNSDFIKNCTFMVPKLQMLELTIFFRLYLSLIWFLVLNIIIFMFISIIITVLLLFFHSPRCEPEIKKRVE